VRTLLAAVEEGKAVTSAPPALAVAILLAVLFFFWLAMIVAALIREKELDDKLLWAGVIFVTPPIGAVLYATFWVVERKQVRDKAAAAAAEDAEDSGDPRDG